MPFLGLKDQGHIFRLFLGFSLEWKLTFLIPGNQEQGCIELGILKDMFFIYFVCGGGENVHICVPFGEKLLRVISLLPTCGSWKWNSGWQTWWQVLSYLPFVDWGF